MLDKIKNIVREYSGDAIINNPSVPNEKNEEAIDTTASSIMNQLKGEASSGNMNSVMDMFKGGSDTSSNPATSKISNGVAGDLMKKLGIDNAAAAGIANKIVPNILGKMKSKSDDPNDKDFDIKDILGSFGGGNLMDSAKNLFGKKD